MRLLLIEDDPTVTKSIELMLRSGRWPDWWKVKP